MSTFLPLLKGEIKTLRRALYHRVYSTKSVTDRFAVMYFDAHMFGETWVNTHWMGVQLLKCPTDLWVYQEIIYELKPDLIFECGTYSGGSAHFLASMCDLVNHGEVVTIDIEEKEGRPTHRRLHYWLGSSVSQEILSRAEELARGKEKVMVILDSNHSRDHVLKELRSYGRLVTKGSYIVVEDTVVNGHPVLPEYGPGPMEAVDAFLDECKDFKIDKTREKFYLTSNSRGYLKKVM